MSISIETLKRYFSGNYSRKDFLLIREKLKNAEQDRELRELMKAHWDEFSAEAMPEENIDNILHRLHHHIHLEENREIRRLDWWKVFQRVAAIIIFPIVLTFLGYLVWQTGDRVVKPGYAEIQCPMGVRTKFQLPDGTTGFLNSGSALQYPVVFDKSRQVKLIGEGFFDVVKNEEIPFIVQTNSMNINVWGTSFNVVSYPDEAIEEVVLQSGRVFITGKSGNRIAELAPNQKLTVDIQTGKGIKSSVIASQYTSWKEGKLVFRNEDMRQVARRLSRWYNAEIIVADPQLYSYTFYATFQDEQMDEVLKLLALTTPIKYEEVKRELSEDGLYSKRKIIIKTDVKKIDKFK